MVNTLYKVAEELLPPKTKAKPRDAIEFIGEALNNKVKYKDVWEKAQEIVRTKYKDDEKALSLLDNYFNK